MSESGRLIDPRDGTIEVVAIVPLDEGRRMVSHYTYNDNEVRYYYPDNGLVLEKGESYNG